jgi:hypothetical protein
MNQLCQMITSGSANRLKDISVELKNNEIKTRLTVNDFVPNFTSKLKITLIKNSNYPYFENLISYESSLANRSDRLNAYYTLLGKKELSL